jgi:hypothetical protein
VSSPTPPVIAGHALGIGRSMALCAVFYGVAVTVFVALELLRLLVRLPVDMFTSLLIQQLIAWPITLGIALLWTRTSLREVCPSPCSGSGPSRSSRAAGWCGDRCPDSHNHRPHAGTQTHGSRPSKSRTPPLRQLERKTTGTADWTRRPPSHASRPATDHQPMTVSKVATEASSPAWNASSS